MSQAELDIVDHEKTEELLDHAEENITALILGTVAYLKQNKLPVAEWVTFLGERVAPSWDEVKGQGAREVARLLALNITIAGGDIHALSGDDSRAELQCSWPDAEDLSFFGLTRDDIDPITHVYQPVAAFLGLRYETRRDGEMVTITVAR